MPSIPALPARVSLAFTVATITDKDRRMKLFSNTIDRNASSYTARHYRAHWQPIWAVFGLVACTLLLVLQGWNAVYDLAAHSKGVSREDSIVDLVAAYLGVSVAQLVLNR